MTAVTFDTLIYAKRLKEVGFTEQQAEVQAEILKNVVDNSLATKHDIEGVCDRLDRVENRLDKLESKVDTLKSKLDGLELTLTIRLGTMIVAAAGILAALIKF